jgi:hypothetical protein
MPGAVMLARILMYIASVLVALLGLLIVVESLRANGQARAGLSGALANSVVGTALVYALIAAGLAVLSARLGAGGDAARFVTYVVAAMLAPCCGGVNLFGLLGYVVPADLTRPDDTFNASATLAPPWYVVSMTGTCFAVTVLLLAVIVLLSLPAANRYFRPLSHEPSPGNPGRSNNVAPRRRR